MRWGVDTMASGHQAYGMTIETTARPTSMTERVAEEIRGLLGKRRVSQAELARQLGQSQMWVSDRLRGAQPLDLNDVERIAGVLGVQPLDLFSAAEVGTTLRYPQSHVPAPRRPVDSRPSGRSDSRAPRDGRPRRIGQTFAASRVAS